MKKLSEIKAISEMKTIGDLNLNLEQKKEWAINNYPNVVLAVREMEAIANSEDTIDLSTTNVDWASACELHSNMRGSYPFYASYMEGALEEAYDEVGCIEGAIQKLSLSYYMFNFAYENAVVFRINELKNFIDSGTKVEALNFNKMNDYIKSIRNKDGDFVYFGETNEPIVVKGLSSELKAKADENGMIKLSDMVEDLKLRMEKETA
tara:strand:- start:928 stop:1548 length:621 start_codon:yes stop_codon:yes gene_type:complete